LPPALRDALRYGPAAALMAVVAPEVLMPGGLMLQTLQDARLWGAVAGAAAFLWRRNLLLTIVCGMAVMLPLRLGLGW
jgi:branched-subunit amino acid transport protein